MNEYTVLLYHGVHADDLELALCNSSGKHIQRYRFVEQMQWLSENRTLVSMSDIDRAHRGEGAIPDGAVAVNFDDGFLNNYTEAWPVLEEYEIPATIYLATGFIGTGRMVWSDRIEAAILNTTRRDIHIELDGGARSWPLSSNQERVTAFGEIKKLCKAMADDIKEKTVADVETKTGFVPDPVHPLYAFMNWSQVREMNASPFIDFGGHTIDHVSLSRVPRDEMHRQIDVSLDKISSELMSQCRHFSYPEGQSGDYNEDVIDYLKSRNISISPSAIDGRNLFPGTDPFHIRRIMVGFENCPFPFDQMKAS